MKSSVNIIVVQGGVVRDPNLKYVGSEGLAIAEFSIAVSSFAYKNGEKAEDVSYFNVSSFGKLAEICSTYLKKGSQIILSGKLKQSRWIAEDGKSKSTVRIIAQDVKFLPSKKKFVPKAEKTA